MTKFDDHRFSVEQSRKIIEGLVGKPCNDENGNRIGLVEEVWVEGSEVKTRVVLDDTGEKYISTIMMLN